MFQIINRLHASALNSSYRAFNLALTDSKNLGFAKKIISVKNDNAYARLNSLAHQRADIFTQRENFNKADLLMANKYEYCKTELKIHKYTSYLAEINYIEIREDLMERGTCRSDFTYMAF